MTPFTTTIITIRVNIIIRLENHNPHFRWHLLLLPLLLRLLLLRQQTSEQAVRFCPVIMPNEYRRWFRYQHHCYHPRLHLHHRRHQQQAYLPHRPIIITKRVSFPKHPPLYMIIGPEHVHATTTLRVTIAHSNNNGNNINNNHHRSLLRLVQERHRLPPICPPNHRHP